MKKGYFGTYVAAGIVAVLLIGGSVGYSVFVSDIAGDIKDSVIAISHMVDGEDYTSGEEILDSLLSYIDNKETLLGATINHNDIYNLRRSLLELRARLEEKEKSECLACLAELDVRISQLKQSSVPSLFNVL